MPIEAIYGAIDWSAIDISGLTGQLESIATGVLPVAVTILGISIGVNFFIKLVKKAGRG